MNQLSDRSPEYAAGLMSAEERREFELALEKATAEELAELRDYDQVAVSLFERVATPVEPSEATNRRILGAVRRAAPSQKGPTTTAEPRESSASPWGWIALAASMAALAFAAFLFSELRTTQTEVDGLRAERDAAAIELAALRQEISSAREGLISLSQEVSTMAFPERRTVVLAGLEGAPSSTATTIVRASSGAATFRAFGLPQLASDRTYQLWYILDSGPVSAGIFTVDGQGDAQVGVSGLPADPIAAWAVSIEPAGGAPQPTGEIVLQG